ncbi:hypothetical protein B0A48_18444 [Cryoendolithus antarcticus]|uniref:Uncharacterized protein n=1 Tax=Cryoendolithus antarcticus TaxID=1507870 RepID=A0A1V8S977_9PEZI|nr:hypothetical protein B0A48_18444 [Cryoendolithus antarcticus]
MCDDDTHMDFNTALENILYCSEPLTALQSSLVEKNAAFSSRSQAYKQAEELPTVKRAAFLAPFDERCKAVVDSHAPPDRPPSLASGNSGGYDVPIQLRKRRWGLLPKWNKKPPAHAPVQLVPLPSQHGSSGP